MTVLLIDAGNTRLKWACVDQQGELSTIQYSSYETGQIADCLRVILIQQPDVKQILFLHVLGQDIEIELLQLAAQRQIKLQFVRTPVQGYGVRVAYQEAGRLGADRFVAMVAAHQLSLKQPVVVIDAGTALTIDTIDNTGQHLGGLILSGLSLSSEALISRSKAKHMNQADLSNISLFAKDTLQAIGSGSVYGVAASIDGITQRIQQTLQKPVQCILTGGDATLLQAYLLGGYVLHEDLVMRGLKYMVENWECTSG